MKKLLITLLFIVVICATVYIVVSAPDSDLTSVMDDSITASQASVLLGDYGLDIEEASALELLREIKKMALELPEMTDEQLDSQLDEIAADHGITLTQRQRSGLATLFRTMEKLSSQDLTAVGDGLWEKTTSVLKNAAGSVKDVVSSVVKYLRGIF